MKTSKSVKKRNIDEELREEYLSLAKLRGAEVERLSVLRNSQHNSIDKSKGYSNTKHGYSNSSVGFNYPGNPKSTIEQKIRERYNDNKHENTSGSKERSDYYSYVNNRNARGTHEEFRTPNQFYTPKDINEHYGSAIKDLNKVPEVDDQKDLGVIEFEMDIDDN